MMDELLDCGFLRQSERATRRRDFLRRGLIEQL